MLKDGERLDDLEYKGLKIIQHPDGYCFTSDSVLLSNLINVKRTDRVVDLGTGSGIIAILTAAKYQPKTVYGVEIQKRLADMATRSVEFNNLSEKVNIVCAPIEGVEKIIGGGFDVVTVNPPYDKPILGVTVGEREICRSEILMTAEDCLRCAAKLLKYGGLFYMVNRASRLTDVIFAMRSYCIEPKKILLIQPKRGKNIDTFIVEGKKGARPSLLMPEPIVVYNDDGSFTEVTRRLYNK